MTSTSLHPTYPQQLPYANYASQTKPRKRLWLWQRLRSPANAHVEAMRGFHEPHASRTLCEYGMLRQHGDMGHQYADCPDILCMGVSRKTWTCQGRPGESEEVWAESTPQDRGRFDQVGDLMQEVPPRALRHCPANFRCCRERISPDCLCPMLPPQPDLSTLQNRCIL